jgi:YD repeat-containing protein
MEIKYTVYDIKGNPIESVNSNGIKTCYIWGYNGLFLIAKIDNCSFDKIKTISTLSNIETTLLTAGLSTTQENALRAIKDAEVTTFDYIPFVGLKKMTDPTGKTTTYERDGDGKLEKIKNDAGNLLNQYNYLIRHITTLPNH